MSESAKSAAARENRKNFRIQLDVALRVVLSSIGATVRYEMVTKNVSTNGFFLDFEKPGRFPFTPSSIMEVWLELAPGNTIFFNGKMARVVREANANTGPGIAIKIVQIDRDNELALRDFVISRHQQAESNSAVA
jgi:hypothetical protein